MHLYYSINDIHNTSVPEKPTNVNGSWCYIIFRPLSTSWHHLLLTTRMIQNPGDETLQATNTLAATYEYKQKSQTFHYTYIVLIQ